MSGPEYQIDVQITVGRDAEWPMGPFRDFDTGEIVDWTAYPDRFALSIDVVLADDTVAATLNNLGTGDGTITGHADGMLTCELPAAATAEIPPNSLAAVPTWRSQGVYPFDLLLIDLDTNSPRTLLRGLFIAHEAITEGS